MRQRISLGTGERVISESTVEAVGAQRHIIKRPRLTRLLDETTARIILLVAPAGYGKTTLAREWCESRQGPTAWYQCTPASVDIAALATGVADALNNFAPDAGPRLRERLRIALGPDVQPDRLAAIVAEALPPAHMLLVLDDYHLVGEGQGASFVELLLERTNLRALIAARQKPSWATARKASRGRTRAS